MKADIALVTERRYTAAAAPPDDWYLANILEDDRLLAEALAERGLSSRRVAWCDPNVDWSSFRAGVLRSTWDYFHRFDEFVGWMDRVERLTRWYNEWPTVRWNLDKHYLADLQARGVRVVPTRFLERGDETPLTSILTELDCREAVIKPCVSGAARHTHRVSRENATLIDAQLAQLRMDEAFLVQPFQHSIQTEGERSLMVFDGRCTHAVRKRAKAGDFRVQDDHGGTVHEHPPTSAEAALAERAAAECMPLPAYARVDLVTDNEGALAVMELELIEPELWLRRSRDAARAFASAVARRVANAS